MINAKFVRNVYVNFTIFYTSNTRKFLVCNYSNFTLHQAVP